MKWLLLLKILGAILVFIQGFFLLLYWNWPFGSNADRYYLPLIALAVSMLGYLLALWQGKYGGIMMICGAVLLVISGFLNPKTMEIQEKLLFILIAGLPPVVIGGLFIKSSGKSKSFKKV